MKLVTFLADDSMRYGFALGENVIDLPAAARSRIISAPSLAFPDTLLDLLRREDAGMDAARSIAGRIQTVIANHGANALASEGVLFPVNRIAWRSPLQNPSRMFSLRGNNPILLRLDHLPMPQHPFLTMRYHGKLLGHQEPMVLRAVDGDIGWGAEFLVVLGRGGRNISAAQASQHILGYAAINDMNGGVFRTIAPDLAPRPGHGHAADAGAHGDASAWYTTRDEHYAGKFYGTWSMPQPVGPWLVTADEIANPYDLVVHSRESGTPCDTVTTAAMILKFEDVIEFMSSFMTLKPGDMISSGALGWHTIPGQKFYPPDSTFEIEIEGIGILQNPIIDRRRGEQA